MHQLVQRFGRDHAQAVWDAGLAAIDQIHEIVDKERIACAFTRVPGYLHASLISKKNESRALKRDANLARELGFAAEFVANVPVFWRSGVRFANQATFHPLMYLAELITRIPGRGSHVFERTEASEFESGDKGGSIKVRANDRTLTCGSVVMATDVPLTGLSHVASAAALQTKITGYTSYAIGATLPRNVAPEASFWDTSNPYYYLRIDARGRRCYAILGGLDHKTGQARDTGEFFNQLERTLLDVLPQAKVDRRWSGQVIESHDGLPLIGETARNQFIATGFSGNGITFGTVAAVMIRDALIGRNNPWREWFAPDRKQIRGAVWNYLTENLEYPYYLVKDRVASSEGKSLRSLKRGQGKILRLDGKRVAAYRDTAGKTTVLSPVCTHLGCIVHWNEAESSWDCPCHGSRFGSTGKLLAGPAETPLEPIKKKRPPSGSESEITNDSNRCIMQSGGSRPSASKVPC